MRPRSFNQHHFPHSSAMQDNYINEVKAKCILSRVVKSTVLASFPIKITSGKQTDSTILLGKPPPTRVCNSKCPTFHKAGMFRLFLKYASNQSLYSNYSEDKPYQKSPWHGGNLSSFKHMQIGRRWATAVGILTGKTGKTVAVNEC